MRRTTLMLILALPLATGCMTLCASNGTPRVGESSSLVDYLYPNAEIPPAADATASVNWQNGGGSTGIIFLLFLLAIGLCALSRKSPHER